MITSQRLLQVFLILGIVYSVLLLTGNDSLTWHLKPFLLPFLFYAVVKSTPFETKRWLLFALLFSWIGDCILMFADKGELYFIFGLIAFLIAHILFIRLFFRQTSENKHAKNPLFWIGFIGIIIYLKSMLSLLFPSLGDLKVPVSFYAMTISIMLVIALKGAFNWETNSKYIILIGAFFFVTSDSILAIDKFHAPIPLATFWIMLTYLIAQFCITYGILKLNQKKQPFD
ncbi:lysoplasmalogenase [Flavobacterium paronense]|uniref:Lysoplasmalogenase n=1 Tax=Flavobacterium paronense TaxID=1392775 RepID=A0ABV5GC11_9FLAO|nr:lysoplasmalogenase [Flavobacterium paronense]MDN3677707.1 lysoplasmalogenase [Flavobacterium paronense]